MIDFLLPACRICHSSPLPSSVKCSLLFFPPLSTVHITSTLRGLLVLLSPWLVFPGSPGLSFGTAAFSSQPEAFPAPSSAWRHLIPSCSWASLGKSWFYFAGSIHDWGRAGKGGLLSFLCFISHIHRWESLGPGPGASLAQPGLVGLTEPFPCEGRKTWLGWRGSRRKGIVL